VEKWIKRGEISLITPKSVSWNDEVNSKAITWEYNDETRPLEIRQTSIAKGTISVVW
jgi:hypothetical protein